jgi:hypothetical protein
MQISIGLSLARPFQVLGSPPFNPTDIAGLQLWLDGADASTITQSGGNVSQWNDKSGNANNAIQGTGANQPAYATNQIGSLPGITFTGSQILDVSAIASNNTTGFVVFQTSNASITGGFLGGLSSFYFGYFGLQEILQDSSNVTYSVGAAINVPAEAGYTVGSGSGQLYVDGALVSSGSMAVSDPIQTVGNALGVRANASIGEILVYNSILSTANMNAVYAYLKTKWGTP